MNDPRPWRSLAGPTVAALVGWFLTVGALVLFFTHNGRCFPSSIGPLPGYMGCPNPEPANAVLSFVTQFTLGTLVIVAVAYGVRLRAVRLDLVAFVVWTVLFAFAASTPSSAPADRVCLPPGDAANVGGAGACYLPWAPGVDRMVVWLLVAGAILSAGYLSRHVRFARR